MTRKIGAIAIIAVVGIGVCFLVIGTPAVTTLRIAGKALLSPSRGASWEDFQEPTRGKLERAIAHNPDDWKLQLLRLKCLSFDEYVQGTDISEGAQAKRMHEFERLIAGDPQMPVVRPAYLRWLISQSWDFYHPVGVVNYPPWRPGDTYRWKLGIHAARNVRLVKAAEDQLRALARGEPDNTAWPYLLAYCRFAHIEDNEALAYVKKATHKTRFSMHQQEEVRATVDACVSLGMPRPEAAVLLDAQQAFPGSGALDDTARIAACLADRKEARGDLRAAAEIRLALIDVGRLIGRTEHYVSVAEAGHTIEDLGYGYRDIKMGAAVFTTDAEWHEAALARAKQREKAFLDFLSNAGMAELSGRYARGLEEQVEYSAAVGRFSETPQGDIDRPFRLLGLAYGLAPVGWVALAVTVAALVPVALLKVLVRGKGAAPGARTVFGVGLVGGIAFFCLLAASAILATIPPYAPGVLESVTVTAREVYGFPPAVIYSGIGLVVSLTAWALKLILRAPRSRLWSVAFLAVCPIAAVAFWEHAWLALASASPIDPVTVALHVVLGIVSVGAMAAVWSAWARKVREGIGIWVAAVASAVIFAVFVVVFFPISMISSLVLVWLIVLFSIPASVAIAAVVVRLVSIARPPAEERPSYLGILRPALAVCLAWILVLQFASLIWLGAWRAKAAAEIERAYATSENQAVLRIMKESGGVRETQ